VGVDDWEEGFEGGSGGEDFVGEGGALLGGVGVAGEVEHPAAEDVGEVDEVGGAGVAILFHDVDAFPHFDPVAGEAAEGLFHSGEEGNGAGSGEGAGLDHKVGEVFGVVVGLHEGAGAGLDVEDEGVEVFGEFFAHDAGGDEVGRLDGADVVAEGVEDAVGGDEGGGLADERGSALAEDFGEALEGDLGVEAGDGFELVEGAAGVTEGAAGDHGDADSGDTGWSGLGEAGGSKDGGDEDRGLVADAAGGVLVDCEGVERGGVEGFAGVAHGGGEVGKLLRVEAAQEDGHNEGGGLGVGDGAVNDAADEGLDFSGGEGLAVTLVADDVYGVDGGFGCHWTQEGTQD